MFGCLAGASNSVCSRPKSCRNEYNMIVKHEFRLICAQDMAGRPFHVYSSGMLQDAA